MKLQQKYIDFKIDEKSFHPDGLSSRIIRAYASTWDVDLAGDRIERGAFLKSIERRFTTPMAEKGKSDIRFLFQHDPKECIGTINLIKEDDKGLYVECYISRTKRGDDLLVLLKDGAIDKMSIGYIPIDFEEEGNIRVLKEVDIFEASIVVFPMNESTDIFEVRSKDMAKAKVNVKATKKEATLLDFELKELAYRAEQVKAEIKAGKVLSGGNKKKLLLALSSINEVLCSALPYDEEDSPTGNDGIQTCSACGQKECKCESCSTDTEEEKSSDSSAPNKEGVVDPIRAKNPSNPQTSPIVGGDHGGEDLDPDSSFNEDEEAEDKPKKSSIVSKDISLHQNNNVDNIDLADYLRSMAETISRIK